MNFRTNVPVEKHQKLDWKYIATSWKRHQKRVICKVHTKYNINPDSFTFWKHMHVEKDSCTTSLYNLKAKFFITLFPCSQQIKYENVSTEIVCVCLFVKFIINSYIVLKLHIIPIQMQFVICCLNTFAYLNIYLYGLPEH